MATPSTGFAGLAGIQYSNPWRWRRVNWLPAKLTRPLHSSPRRRPGTRLLSSTSAKPRRPAGHHASNCAVESSIRNGSCFLIGAIGKRWVVLETDELAIHHYDE